MKQHSAWNRVQILVDSNGTFYAKVDDIEIRDDRLATVREKIDRALKPTAKKPKLALPVLVISDDAATPTTLTGVSRSNRGMEFSPAVKVKLYDVRVIADTPANRERAESLLVARRALEDAREAVERRQIAVDGYGHVEIEAYQSLVARLSAAHKRSAAGGMRS